LYEELLSDQINNAILLPGSEAWTGEGLTDYFMIPNDNPPLLEPLLLIPGIGQPLYDLLEPDTRILVNLGYGSITEGWNQGPANVPTTFGLFPQIDQTQLSDAMSNAWQQGVTAALHDLQHPISYQDQVAPLQLFADAGNFLDALLDPTSANTALVPYDFILGVAPSLFATLGTAVNFMELFS
jgi:PE-PPE domain-containing protein